MSKAIRQVYGESLLKYGAQDPDVVVFDADVSGSTKSAVFGKAYPERFFNCGISEYAMMGMAAGMAKNGKKPFVNAFAVFETTLGLQAARLFMSYSGLPIRMMGGYGGLSAAYDGATHHAIEDIAIMRTLPGIRVMVASDAMITDWMVKTAVETDEPVYIKLSREAAKDCHPADAVFEPGKAMVVREGTDVTVIACGQMVGEALGAADALAEKGISVRVVDMFCIKPLDRECVIACAKETGAIVTAEEHSVIGGLGSAVCEVLTQEGIAVPFGQIGMKDRHAESGAYKDLFVKYGLDSAAIAEAAEQAARRKS